MSESSATNAFTEIISDGLDDYTTNARGDVGSLVRIEAVKAARALWVDAESEVSASQTMSSPTQQLTMCHISSDTANCGIYLPLEHHGPWRLRRPLWQASEARG